MCCILSDLQLAHLKTKTNLFQKYISFKVSPTFVTVQTSKNKALEQSMIKGCPSARTLIMSMTSHRFTHFSPVLTNWLLLNSVKTTNILESTSCPGAKVFLGGQKKERNKPKKQNEKIWKKKTASDAKLAWKMSLMSQAPQITEYFKMCLIQHIFKDIWFRWEIQQSSPHIGSGKALHFFFPGSALRRQSESRFLFF